ncbi:unnamed protein product [Cladocopium goreaui]|uniref:Uncharacterized protein n=1 Tax=Cladocopium goreaui TaxID=2562237 RepID=A0A9P1BXG2_9DINO|nr:unnamed protein product [Cladocopium goreaui]
MPSNVLKRDRTDNVFAHVVKMKRDVDHLTEVSELWAKALKKWHTVLACTGYAGLVGATVRDMVCDGKELEGTLRDVFGNKSRRTANKRASTMLALFSWLDRKKLQVWPIKPEYVAAYLNESNVGGAGSTKGKTLMEALRFCKYVMRLPELDEIIDDPVLTGRVRRLDAARDTVKQSRPLLLSEVKFIEEFLVSDLNIFDRYIAGCILFAIYSRSRWSDLAFLSDLTLDTTETELGLVGFVEGSTRFQKTSTTALKRAMQMPLVAPIRGVTERLWAVEWFDILKQVQFNLTAKPIGDVASACSEEPMRVRVKVENFPEGLSTQSRSEADHVLGVVDLTESSWSLVGSPVSEQDARQESPARASSDDSSSSSTSSSAQEEPLQQKYALYGEVKDCNEPVYQHKQSRVLHRPNKVAGSLACGRRLGDNHRFLEQGASFKWARCSVCFKGEVITKTDQLAEAMAAIHARRTAQ